MKIFIAGGTGFVGRHLARHLLNAGHDVVATGTRLRAPLSHQKLTYIAADTTLSGDWQEALKSCDAVVNLAGRSIFNYWTSAYKEEIYNSRILTTRNIVEAMPAGAGKVLCSTSAVGYYGSRGDEVLTEESSAGDDFLAKLGIDWENEALSCSAKGARVVLMRFGIVLGKDGGAMKQMLPAFQFGLGGPLGNGKHWFPWIHIDDLVQAILFCITRDDISGVFNFTAPHPVRNKAFTKALGGVLKRPTFLPAPSLALRLLMGELGEVLLSSQRAVPDALEKAGYGFKYEYVKDALREIVA